MEFKIWDNANKVMYLHAENIDDPKWNFGRLHHNAHCTTCVSVGAYDKNNVTIFTNDMVIIKGVVYYVSDLVNGETLLKGMNANITERLNNYDSKDIEVIGSVLELD